MRSGWIASASVSRVTRVQLVGEVGIRGRDALELEEVPEVLDLVEVDAHVLPQQQVTLLLDHRERAEARLQRGLERRGSSTGISR